MAFAQNGFGQIREYPEYVALNHCAYEALYRKTRSTENFIELGSLYEQTCCQNRYHLDAHPLPEATV
jgi:hypothetical protein